MLVASTRPLARATRCRPARSRRRPASPAARGRAWRRCSTAGTAQPSVVRAQLQHPLVAHPGVHRRAVHHLRGLRPTGRAGGVDHRVGGAPRPAGRRADHRQDARLRREPPTRAGRTCPAAAPAARRASRQVVGGVRRAHPRVPEHVRPLRGRQPGVEADEHQAGAGAAEQGHQRGRGCCGRRPPPGRPGQAAGAAGPRRPRPVGELAVGHPGAVDVARQPPVGRPARTARSSTSSTVGGRRG